MSAPSGVAPRLAAARELERTLHGAGPAPAAPQTEANLTPRDLAFSRHLVFGVLRWLSALDWLAAGLMKRPLRARDRDVQWLLRIGLYQLWRDETPPHAAVHATVAAVKQLGKPWAAGLLNAVLRGFLRRRDELLGQLGQRPERHAHPQWLLRALQEDWPNHWRQVVEANNTPPPLWLRINRQRTDREAYDRRLQEGGFSASWADTPAEAVRIEPAMAVEHIPGFPEGQVSVQDAAAQWAAHYLETEPGQRVLDACAAPGGKTCHLLESTPSIRLTAIDDDALRLGLLRENLERLGLDCEVLEGDAGDPGDWGGTRRFDRILLDAPCSATGVIRRHPEIKWLRDPGQVDNAIREQARLLDALWPLLDSGGMLVYATCSVLKRENSHQIESFLSRHPEAVVDPLGTSKGPGRQILPGQDDMDGFFYARLRRPA